jgi:hypothetical protein
MRKKVFVDLIHPFSGKNPLLNTDFSGNFPTIFIKI